MRALTFIFLVLLTGCRTAGTPKARFVFGQVRATSVENREAIERAVDEIKTASRGIEFSPSK